MSEFHVEVVEVKKVQKHPNADSLSVARVNGDYPVIFKTGTYEEGGKAVYVPVDSLVPVDNDLFSFISSDTSKKHRIKAKKLRGIFSMGLLVPADPSWPVGQNVQEELQIDKYEPPVRGVNMNGGEIDDGPSFMPTYTDMESLRRHDWIIKEDEPVVITEKIHGANARFVFCDGELHVGSNKLFRKRNDTNPWWRAAYQYDLEEKLKKYPGYGLYGELFGAVQDLRYGAKNDELRLSFFDVMDKDGRYLDYADFVEFYSEIGLPTVPVLYRGPWKAELKSLAEGKSCLADHVREGIVVKPMRERWDDRGGRAIAKLVGESYLLRKEK